MGASGQPRESSTPQFLHGCKTNGKQAILVLSSANVVKSDSSHLIPARLVPLPRREKRQVVTRDGKRNSIRPSARPLSVRSTNRDGKGKIVIRAHQARRAVEVRQERPFPRRPQLVLRPPATASSPTSAAPTQQTRHRLRPAAAPSRRKRLARRKSPIETESLGALDERVPRGRFEPRPVPLRPRRRIRDASKETPAFFFVPLVQTRSTRRKRAARASRRHVVGDATGRRSAGVRRWRPSPRARVRDPACGGGGGGRVVDGSRRRIVIVPRRVGEYSCADASATAVQIPSMPTRRTRPRACRRPGADRARSGTRTRRSRRGASRATPPQASPLSCASIQSSRVAISGHPAPRTAST